MNNSNKQVKIGIIGCAGIAVKFCESVSEAQNSFIGAVASRSIDKAKKFCENNNCKHATAYGSYDELLNDKTIEAVYIPLPTGIRAEVILKAIEKNKHILSEKPTALSNQELQKIIQACKNKNLQYMDNTMFMHHNRTKGIQSCLEDPNFGIPKLVSSCFSVCFPSTEVYNSNIRSQSNTEPLGVLGDLGWYNIRFSLFAFNYEMPREVSCNFHKVSTDGVPVTISAVLRFSDSRIATFDCSFEYALRQWAEISTENKTLRLDDFVVPQKCESMLEVTEATIGDKALFFPKSVILVEKFKDGKISQNGKLVECFSSNILSLEKTDAFWTDITTKTQIILDACFTSGKNNGEFVSILTI